MKIAVHRSGKDGLLLCGVPLAQGAAPGGTGFVLTDPHGTALPLWWAERAHWPDGSLKWVFLHARLREGSTQLRLETGDGRRGSVALEEDGSLVLDRLRLSFTGAGFSQPETPGIIPRRNA